MNGLENIKEPVNKVTLSKLIEQARTFDEKEYTKESWSQLQSALEMADVVMKDPSSDEASIKNAITALEDALGKLVKTDGNTDNGTDGADNGTGNGNNGSVTNPTNPGGKLPSTGVAIGNAIYLISGLTVVIGAGLIFLKKNKESL